MTDSRVYSRATTGAARLLGAQVRLARRERRWSETDLAERIGVSRATVQKIEKGDPGVTLGLALEACAITGVPLFGAEEGGVQAVHSRHIADKLALLPKRIRKPRPVSDEF
ncbi:helix-turn-helix transcriptional regulator [Rhodospirillum centenum]|uniref:helix-turn-helix transcriptional regulator n=1 Tax=Rhodospirillum centenum TaxID=34018 RepID=UPI0017A1813F|nr:helix-turn-helix transcriptional regulator [Rhodospirillum centenum]